MLLSPQVPLVGVLVQGKLHLLSVCQRRSHAETAPINTDMWAHSYIWKRLQSNCTTDEACESSRTPLINKTFCCCCYVIHTSIKRRLGNKSSPFGTNRLTIRLSIHDSFGRTGSVDKKRNRYDLAFPSKQQVRCKNSSTVWFIYTVDTRSIRPCKIRMHHFCTVGLSVCMCARLITIKMGLAF